MKGPSKRKRGEGPPISLPLSAEDPLVTQKKAVLHANGLSLLLSLTSSSRETLNKFIESARVLSFNEEELYFFTQPRGDEEASIPLISPRNEATALHLCTVALESANQTEFVLELVVGLQEKRAELGGPDTPSTEEVESSASLAPGAATLEWAVERGVNSRVRCGIFEGGLRGVCAVDDIHPGECVLQVPQTLLITQDMAQISALGAALRAAEEDIDDESVALLWTIQQRSNPGAEFATFWASFPESFNTGLSWSTAALALLDGSALLDRTIETRQLVRSSYDALFPRLSRALPQVFPEALFTWEKYKWAAELWNSYALLVKFQDGKQRSCLVPAVGLLNFSPQAHVYRFSCIDAATSSLRLEAARSCQRGSQCYLAYGALPNIQLALFYGFVIEDNPYDVIKVTLEPDPDDPLHQPKTNLLEKLGLPTEHMIGRGRSRQLPTKLLAALRILLLDEEEVLRLPALDPLRAPVGKKNEHMVMETLVGLLEGLLEALPVESVAGQADLDKDLVLDDDIALIQKYCSSERALLAEALENCTRVWGALDSLL
ncbi:hypothetical protein CYMTET_51970 [Cymbomonas tetramitiformis]|uniref:Rubisco LSMT substrate-binding domain-containing protein n=1 Tax=Cymbomonas tetramitiformis TaxID=36881 RepID=A0AAE0ET58_9CHLO|nr:hypothetical protein CYMTET_51970 [Cymbomonas tetramitiformis]